jgi:hypothetical protein
VREQSNFLRPFIHQARCPRVQDKERRKLNRIQSKNLIFTCKLIPRHFTSIVCLSICPQSPKAQSRQSAKLFLQSSELGLAYPLSRGRERPPPPTLWSGGEGTLACGRGIGGVPIPTSGHTLWCSIYNTGTYISTLCPKV